MSTEKILCLFCAEQGHSVSACHLSTPLKRDERIRRAKTNSLRDDSTDQLCYRCSRYPLVDIATDQSRITSELDRHKLMISTERNIDGRQIVHETQLQIDSSRMPLGTLAELELVYNCPLCRLIYAVFPGLNEEMLESGMPFYLRPFLALDRQASLLNDTPKELQHLYSIYFAVEHEEDAWRTTLTDANQATLSNRAVDAFALSRNSTQPRTGALAVRYTEAYTDFNLLKRWLSICESSHGDCCRVRFRDELLTSRMIDVNLRLVVDCPKDCKYAALSYVWGGVQPGPQALANRTLPRTIEDALCATQELGLQYLWVDALCVDQFPSPQQRQQLAMMDVIYQSAYITFVATSGVNADAGLAGIGQPAERMQARETVGGKQFCSVLPTIEQELEPSIYYTRAWTMQESLLTNRRMLFTSHQIHFACNTARFSESVDDTYDPANYLQCFAPEFFWQDPKSMSRSYEELVRIGRDDYASNLEVYTSRKMTNDRDSLNAFFGIIGYLSKVFFWREVNPFQWGLPLTTTPQSLRWFHKRSVTPRRRPDFPSWSWAGWEGEVVHHESLNPVHYSAVHHPDRLDVGSDMIPRYLGLVGNVLDLEGFLVQIDIRTEPFSEAYLPGIEKLLGMVRERNFLHNNTIASGFYDALVVERLHYRFRPDGPLKQEIYLLLLELKAGGMFSRLTQITIFMEPDAMLPTTQTKLKIE